MELPPQKADLSTSTTYTVLQQSIHSACFRKYDSMGLAAAFQDTVGRRNAGEATANDLSSFSAASAVKC